MWRKSEEMWRKSEEMWRNSKKIAKKKCKMWRKSEEMWRKSKKIGKKCEKYKKIFAICQGNYSEMIMWPFLLFQVVQ